MPKIVDMKPLKDWVAENLPPSSELRQVIQKEDDKVPISEYIEKMKVWWILSDIELKKK